MTEPTPPRAPRLCMLAYAESPVWFPPMLHEGISLARSGVEVEALCVEPPGAVVPSPPEVHVPGFTTRRIEVRTRRLFRAVFRGRDVPRPLAAVQHLASYGEFVVKALVRALASGADAYEAHDLPPLLPAVLAAKLRGKPVVYRAHELWPEADAKVRFAAIWRLLDRALVPRCDLVVTPDDGRSAIYRDELGARAALTVRNCPPYRPPLASALLRDELDRRGVAFSTIVLYQGLVDSRRCVEEIAQASRGFDEGVVLVVLGSGFGRWADAATALAPYERVVVLPRVRYEDLAQYTASADVGILLYRNDCRNNYLCAPNKVFEYMMMGLPVIAPAFPGMQRLVLGEDVGLCVDPADPRQIAAAVNRLARDAGARARMRANGLRLSRERYCWELESRPLLERHLGLLRADGRERARAAG